MRSNPAASEKPEFRLGRDREFDTPLKTTSPPVPGTEASGRPAFRLPTINRTHTYLI